MSNTKNRAAASAKARIEGWDAIAEFYGRSVRAMFNLRDRDPSFRGILRRWGRTVFVLEEDAVRHRDRVFVTKY